MWVGHNEAQDRTMSAVGKILLGIETEYKGNELDKPKRTGHARACQQSCRNGNKNSNSFDVVNEVFLRRVNVPAVPLLKTSYLQLESYYKRSGVQFCVKECARGVRDRTQRATGICRYLLCSSLLSVIVEIKSSLVACGVPYGFLDLDRDSHSFEKNANTLGKSKKLIRTSFWIALTLLPWVTYDCVQGRFGASVFEMKTFEPGSKSILGLEPAKQVTENLMSGLLTVSERNVDLKIFSPAEIAGVARRLLVMELKQSVFNEPHEDLEQTFCAEIAIVEKHLKTVKETEGNKRIMQTAERVERSDNEESQVGKVENVYECAFNVLIVFRATDLMFGCGLTYTAASRKAKRACVILTLSAQVPVLRFELLGSCLTRPCER